MVVGWLVGWEVGGLVGSLVGSCVLPKLFEGLAWHMLPKTIGGFCSPCI